MAQRAAVGNAAYTALSTDRIVAYTALSAAETVTLPAAASFPVGERLLIIDESGLCSMTNTITVPRASADTINGQASLAINVAYGFLALEEQRIERLDDHRQLPRRAGAKRRVHAVRGARERLSRA